MLPNHEQAYIPEPKLTKYLLSETHAVGKSKAKYFRSLGYTEANADQLADGLLMIAKSEPITHNKANSADAKVARLISVVGTTSMK